MGQTGRAMTFQKRDGRQFVAVWLEQYGYDVNTRQRLAVRTETWTLTLPDGVALRKTYRWQPDGTARSADRPLGPGSHPLTVSDSLTILELDTAAVPSRAPLNVRVARTSTPK
jgi:hypothetical protein